MTYLGNKLEYFTKGTHQLYTYILIVLWNHRDILFLDHYSDVKMGTIVSQITSLTIVYSTVYSDADQIKHQSSASLAFVRGIHRGPVTRKSFHLMTSSWTLGFYSLLSGRTSCRKISWSKPRDSDLNFSNRLQIWQAPRQKPCQDACQMSDHYSIQSRDLETSRDFAGRRLTA